MAGTLRLGRWTPAAPTVVVTLVHGTFASDCEWVEPESPFGSALASGGSVRLVPFRWSGSNSVSERHRAAQALVAQLKETLTSSPDARHFVVGHSHGGGIALAAGLDDSVRGALAGVACLATPFVRFRRRHESDRLLSTCGMMAMAGAAFWAALAASSAVSAWSRPWVLSVGTGTFLSLFAVLIGLLRRSYASAQRLLEDQVDLNRGNANVLILRNSADEASAGLAAAQFVSWLTHGLWRLVHRSRRLFQQIAATDLRERAAVMPQEGTYDDITNVVVAGVATAGRLASWATLLVGAVMVGPILVLLTAFSAAFGIRSLLAGLMLSISVESTPLGTWLIQQLDIADDEGGRLSHSALLSSEVAANVLRPWMFSVPFPVPARPELSLPATFKGSISQGGSQDYNFSPYGVARSSRNQRFAFWRTGTITVVLDSAESERWSGRFSLRGEDRYEAYVRTISKVGDNPEHLASPAETREVAVDGAVFGTKDRLRFDYESDGVNGPIVWKNVASFTGALEHGAIVGTYNVTTTYRDTLHGHVVSVTRLAAPVTLHS